MAALLVVDLKVKNSEKLKEYGSKTPEILESHKGRVLVKAPIEQLFGTSDFETKVIFEFPTRQDALNWYNSSEYQDLIKIRDEAMESSFHLIEA